MVKIFISYRRADSEQEAGRIYSDLIGTFGKGNVIKDTNDFAIAKDFRAEMIDQITTSDILLALIGKDWLTVTNTHGQSRIHDPDDPVRKEIEWGLMRSKTTVIPVILNKARPPSENDLPSSLRNLAYLNAAFIRNDPDFENDMKRLEKTIRQLMPPKPSWIYWLLSFAAGFIFAFFIATPVLLYFIPPQVLGSVSQAIENARTFRSTNEAWQPFIITFEDGIEMALVPAGCFMRNSVNGVSSEQPIHKVCFDTPFWIDRTEVTQDDFARVGGTKGREDGFVGSDRPVEQITWFEAQEFCELRGARLPTEAEWDYAAYGVESLAYPWGNDWDENKLVWNRNSSQGTANVGSITTGASWVGAMDMNGNVWEWMGLPYQDPQNTGDRGNRVLRGGSWFDDDVSLFQNAVRFTDSPDGWDYFIGFRCVRSTN